MSFSDVQAWMHAAIIAKEAPDNADRFIRSTSEVCAHRRLNVYRDMYRVRMSESLQMDYGLLYGVVGSEEFEKLAECYLEAYPSTSYTLNDLGRNFASFLAAQPGLPPYVPEIARFEYALVRSFDAFDPKPADWSELGTLSEDLLSERTLCPLPSFLGEEFSYQLGALYDAHLDGDLPPGALPEKGKETVLFFRVNFRVHHKVVDSLSWQLYRNLRKTICLGAALDPVLAAADTETAQATLLDSFQQWVTGSLLYVPESSKRCQAPFRLGS
ncbi:MAG: putative DNA-binding domain-containing protein [Bdellovibrionales bacterium]|nr:putative DNA-binding domain-containing protein [Bdellovibrionales bacterium]